MCDFIRVVWNNIIEDDVRKIDTSVTKMKTDQLSLLSITYYTYVAGGAHALLAGTRISEANTFIATEAEAKL